MSFCDRVIFEAFFANFKIACNTAFFVCLCLAVICNAYGVCTVL